ncbi:MAG: nucleotidyltransferase domain-containing protein [Anaerolineae bacterium]|nr:nucleotidyltransferase domain-containing protein [Anaerolineae bacterium]
MPKHPRSNSAVGSRVIPEIIRPLLGEFIAHADEIPGLVSAILYGSAVRGELHTKSDVDVLLLFDTDHDPELGEEATIAQRIGQTAALRTRCPYTFSFVINDVKNLRQLDSDYLWNITKEGIVIWSRPQYLLGLHELPLEPYLIITYDLSKISAKDKRAVHRALYGYRTRRVVAGKVYESTSPGLVRGKIRRLAASVILAPASQADKILDALRARGVPTQQTKVWG